MKTYSDPHLEELGQTIRLARRDHGWTQRELAESAQRHGAPVVHRQEISAMENGRFVGAVRKLLAVLRALNLTLVAQPARRPTIDDLDRLFGDD